MAGVTIHLISGWAYPAATLDPLVKALEPSVTGIPHPFTAGLDRIASAAAPYWLGGWSLGGLLAMKAVLDGVLHPAGLILISSTARFCSGDDYPHGVPRTHLRAMMRGLVRSRESVLASFYDQAGQPVDCDFTTEELSRGLQWLDTLDLRERLHEIEMPVLILHGAEDRIIPVSAAEYLATKIPSSHLIVHPGAGHALPLKNPEWISPLVERWKLSVER